jgi:hypothetical protein
MDLPVYASMRPHRDISVISSQGSWARAAMSRRPIGTDA